MEDFTEQVRVEVGFDECVKVQQGDLGETKFDHSEVYIAHHL